MKFFNLLQNLITIATLALIACWAAPSRLNAEDRVIAKSPNIILVFIDDMGWGDFSCFGNQAVETQNIDRLAKEGIRFEQFYVNSPITPKKRLGTLDLRWRLTALGAPSGVRLIIRSSRVTLKALNTMVLYLALRLALRGK